MEVTNYVGTLYKLYVLDFSPSPWPPLPLSMYVYTCIYFQAVKLDSPDYAGEDAEAAVADFRKRIQQYTEAYQPIDSQLDQELSWLKVFNVDQKYEANRIAGGWGRGVLCVGLVAGSDWRSNWQTCLVILSVRVWECSSLYCLHVWCTVSCVCMPLLHTVHSVCTE